MNIPYFVNSGSKDDAHMMISIRKLMHDIQQAWLLSMSRWWVKTPDIWCCTLLKVSFLKMTFVKIYQPYWAFVIWENMLLYHYMRTVLRRLFVTSLQLTWLNWYITLLTNVTSNYKTAVWNFYIHVKAKLSSDQKHIFRNWNTVKFIPGAMS